MRIRALALIGLTFLIGCLSDTSAPPSSATPSKNLPVQVVPANYEVVVNQPTRFLFGLLLNDGRVVEQGTVHQ